MLEYHVNPSLRATLTLNLKCEFYSEYRYTGRPIAIFSTLCGNFI